jgi:hypothetical protein
MGGAGAGSKIIAEAALPPKKSKPPVQRQHLTACKTKELAEASA